MAGDSDEQEDGERRHLVIPYVFSSHRRHREIILSAASGYRRPIRESEQQNLTRSIARGRAWLQEILAGTAIGAIALRDGKSERVIRMTVSLAFLDPKLVRAALHGALPRGVSRRRLFDAPMLWHEQWRTIGLARPA